MIKFQKTDVMQVEIARVEPLVPIALGVHGIVMLSLSGGQTWHWLAVGINALLGLLGLLPWRVAHAVLVRGLSILALGWLLMLSTGGTGGFFLLWYFVLVAVYPLLLEGLPGVVLFTAAPVLYIVSAPLSTSQVPWEVVFSRAFLLLFIGWTTWTVGNALRRYLSDLEMAVSDLGTLYTASRDLGSSLEPKVVLQELARHLTEALGATSGYILQVDPKCQTMTVIAEYWSARAVLKEHKSDLGRSYLMRDFPSTVRAVAEHSMVSLQADDTDLAATERSQFSEYGIQSALLVPLLLGGQVVGQAEIWDSVRSRAFTANELHLAQMLAAQGAGLIVNARLYEESRQHEAQLTTLLEITRTLSSSLELEEVLTYVTHSMTDILKLEHCAISAYDPVIRSVCTLAVYIKDGSPPKSGGVGVSYPLSDYPATARVIENRKTLIIRATDPEADPAEVALLRLYGRVMMLMVPLHIGNRSVGIIELYTADEERDLMPAEIHLAHMIADQVAVAIDNARLFTETRKLSSVVEQTADNVYICDKQGVIQYVNHAFEEVTGYTKEEVIGQTPRLLKSGQHSQEFYQNLWDTILAGKVFRSQVINRRKDGRLYHELKTITPIKDAQGNITHFVSTGRDITEVSALYDLSRGLADAAYASETILNLVVRNAVEMVHVTFARIRLAEKGYCVIKGAHPVRPLRDDLDLVGHREPIENLPTCFRVAQKNEPAIFHNGDVGLTDRECELLFLGGARTVCLIPLRVGERTLGLLILSEARSEDREPFTPEKIRLARSIGDQAAGALHRAELFAELEEAYLQTVYALANAVDAKDTYTADHAQRLAAMAMAVGREVGLSPRELDDLRYGAILHDIGKIGIPDAILKKPIKLDADEWVLMRQHPEIGARILAPVPRLTGAAKVVHHHHERYDGQGYPCSLAGEAIPLGARILTVVDAYSAIVDQRVYKPPRSSAEAIAELRKNAGTQFDPNIVRIFLEILERGIE